MSNHSQGYKERQLIYIKMRLLSDTIFGNGMSVPGEEDISVLTDVHGFPYYKGSTFKGVFREEMGRLLEWEDGSVGGLLDVLFGEGKPGMADKETESRRLVFSDFVLSPHVRDVIRRETGDDPGKVLECLTNVRAFTRISEEGTADYGSLRYARCVNQGLVFYSTISCSCDDKDRVTKAIPFVKWIGTLRNRGFGHVRIEVEDAAADAASTDRGGED